MLPSIKLNSLKNHDVELFDPHLNLVMDFSTKFGNGIEDVGVWLVGVMGLH